MVDFSDYPAMVKSHHGSVLPKILIVPSESALADI